MQPKGRSKEDGGQLTRANCWLSWGGGQKKFVILFNRTGWCWRSLHFSVKTIKGFVFHDWTEAVPWETSGNVDSVLLLFPFFPPFFKMQVLLKYRMWMLLPPLFGMGSWFNTVKYSSQQYYLYVVGYSATFKLNIVRPRTASYFISTFDIWNRSTHTRNLGVSVNYVGADLTNYDVLQKDVNPGISQI